MSRFRLALIMAAVALVVVGLVSTIIFSWGVYYRHWEGPVVTGIANVLPIPAARVGHESIPLRDYFESLRSIKKYLSSEEATAQNQRRPVVDEDRKNALERLIQESILNALAAERNVTVSDQQVEALMSEINVTATSTEDFAEFISKNYGWSIDDFKKHVARPLVLTRLLGASFAADHGGDLNALEAFVAERTQQSDVVRYLKFK